MFINNIITQWSWEFRLSSGLIFQITQSHKHSPECHFKWVIWNVRQPDHLWIIRPLLFWLLLVSFLLNNWVSFSYCDFNLYLVNYKVDTWRKARLLVPSSKQLGGFKVALILLGLIKWVSGISGNLVIKSKLSSRGGSVALRQLSPIHHSCWLEMTLFSKKALHNIEKHS